LSEPLKHLTVGAVKAIHREVLAAHGGAAGIRDEILLESAFAAPQATVMGRPLLSDPIEIAAAYLFYICKEPSIPRWQQTNGTRCLPGFLGRKWHSPNLETSDRRLGKIDDRCRWQSA
jgi:hypothetical protein